MSWEAARRVANGGEDLRLIPAAIGGDPERRTGVILAKSIPAKKYGVRTGEPVAMALRKCPDLILARPDFRLYEKNSKAFMDICRRYAPVVEKFSIDECFLDMSGTKNLYPDPIKIAYTIKDEIRESLGFTVNVGISRNKLLAKMASDFEKPDKVHTLYPEEVPAKLWPLPVGELFSVGHATAEKLEKAGIRTIGRLAETDMQRVQSLLGNKLGKQLYEYANGIDLSPVLAEPEEARAFCVSVSIRTNNFKNRSHQRKLEEATDVTKEVYEVSRELLCELWKSRVPLRLLGISLMQIVREGEVQLSMFRDEKKERARKLDKALDGIRTRYGMDTIKRGSTVRQSIDVGKKYKAQMENQKEKE